MEASAKASKLEGTPSCSRLGVHHSNVADAALRGNALGAVQGSGQPLSVVTTAADSLQAGKERILGYWRPFFMDSWLV